MANLTPAQRDAYWQKTSRLMWIIMALWVLFSFIIPAFAVQLNQIKIFGFPLVIMTGVSICAPTGTPLLPVAAQPRALAT